MTATHLLRAGVDINTIRAKGIEILSALLERYPVIVSDDEKVELDSVQEYNERVAEVASPTIIDLDEWIISPTQLESLCELGNSEGQPESSETAPPLRLHRRLFCLPSRLPQTRQAKRS